MPQVTLHRCGVETCCPLPGVDGALAALAVTGMLNAFVWVVYGIAQSDPAILVPNTPGLLFGA